MSSRWGRAQGIWGAILLEGVPRVWVHSVCSGGGWGAAQRGLDAAGRRMETEGHQSRRNC